MATATTYTLLITICVLYNLMHTISACDYFNSGPFQISKGNNIGDITIEESVEISFEIQVSTDWICPGAPGSAWCHIMQIGPTGKPRFAMLSLTPPTSLQVGGTDYGPFANQYDLINFNMDNSHFMDTINDGNFHKIYYKFSSTQRIMIYDEQYILLNINNGTYNHSIYYGQQFALLFCRNVKKMTPTNGVIQNICINSTVAPTTNPTIYPTIYPTTEPTIEPTFNPTFNYSIHPTINPTTEPTVNPTPSSCDYYYGQSIDVRKGNVIFDNIMIEETIELSFYVQIKTGWHCPNGDWCNILQIGDPDKSTPRFPAISMITNNGNNAIHLSITDGSVHSYTNYDIFNWYLNESINDGNYHKIYIKFSSTETLFIYENDMVLINVTNHSFDYTQYYGQQYILNVCHDNIYHQIDGAVKDICINTISLPTSNPTVNPTLIPTIDPTETKEIKAREPTLEPTLDPTIAIIIHYVQPSNEDKNAAKADMYIAIGVSVFVLIIIIIIISILGYRKFKKLQKAYKNTVLSLESRTTHSVETETNMTMNSASNSSIQLTQQQPPAFTIPYNKTNENIEGGKDKKKKEDDYKNDSDQDMYNMDTRNMSSSIDSNHELIVNGNNNSNDVDFAAVPVPLININQTATGPLDIGEI